MSATQIERTERRELVGVVLSDKMEKTRVVAVERRLRHSRYGKVQTRGTKVYAHDEKNESHVGDRVRLMETRPLSKSKRWRLVAVEARAAVGAQDEAALGGRA